MSGTLPFQSQGNIMGRYDNSQQSEGLWKMKNEKNEKSALIWPNNTLQIRIIIDWLTWKDKPMLIIQKLHSIWTPNKYKPQKHFDVDVKKLLSD